MCGSIHCSVWPLRRCCMVRHWLAMLLRGFSFGDFWGGSSKWGREGTCTRAGAFPNLAPGATSAGSEGASVGGMPLVPRHAAAGRWPYGAVGWTVGLVGLSVWETRNVQVCAVRSTALCVGTCGPVLCDPLLCVAIAKVLHGAASVGDASPWILVR